MTMAQLQQLACDSGLKGYSLHIPQAELIRKIQVIHGDEPCFATDKSIECTEICQWRRDCRKLKAAWLR